MRLGDWKKALTAVHEELGHRGRERAFAKLSKRYWWPGYYVDVKNHVMTYEQCQLQADKRKKEFLHSISVGLFGGVSTLISCICQKLPTAIGVSLQQKSVPMDG